MLLAPAFVASLVGKHASRGLLGGISFRAFEAADLDQSAGCCAARGYLGRGGAQGSEIGWRSLMIRPGWPTMRVVTMRARVQVLLIDRYNAAAGFN